MPAIRHKTNGTMDILPQIPTSKTWTASVLSKDGELIPVTWLGFICNAGTKYLEGGIAKMVAHQISNGDGHMGTEWVMVPKGHYVLCWRTSWYWAGNTARIGVYGIVDDEGWPMTTASGLEKPSSKNIKFSLGERLAN